MYLFPYSVDGLCEDYPTCDIAYNAVMPLSRASTRGRYNRIVGVTLPQVAGKCAPSLSRPGWPMLVLFVQRTSRQCKNEEKCFNLDGPIT